MRAGEGRSNLGLPFCTNSKYLSLAGCRPFSRRQFACPRCRTPRCRSWLPPTRGARIARASPEIECPSGLSEAENLSSVRPARAPPPARGSPDLLKETRPSAASEKKEGGEIRRKKVFASPWHALPVDPEERYMVGEFAPSVHPCSPLAVLARRREKVPSVRAMAKATHRPFVTFAHHAFFRKWVSKCFACLNRGPRG